MADELRLAEDFTLPIDAVTETFVIFARRGSGKTYTASVLIEEMIGAGLPTCVIDPMGVWWGLRSSADGAGPGLPVTILGGSHADLPLPADAGAVVADLVVTERLPVVLDLSELSKTAQRRFLTDFLEHLFRANREALHLVIDEADLFAPQRGTADIARLLGAYEDVCLRGRARGLGCTSITQRPATLHTNIRSQAEVLIALRMTGKHDIGAIDDWVRVHAEDEQAREVKASLPTLPVGTAWVWSPGWLDILVRTTIRRRRTFDSSATPKPGQRVVVPREFAAVNPQDVARLRDRLAQVLDSADTDTGVARPQAQRELARLRAQVAQLQARPPVVRRIGVPVLTSAAAEGLRETTARLEAITAELRSVLDHVGQAGDVDPVEDHASGGAAQPTEVDPAATTAPRRTALSTSVAPTSPAPSNGRPGRGATSGHGGSVELKAGARRMLDVLARQHPIRLTRAQLATLARMKATGGTFGTYFSVLRTRELISQTGTLVGLTEQGLAAAGLQRTGTPMTSDEIRDQWMAVLKAGARMMLDVVLRRWPESTSRAELAAAAGLEVSGGTFGTYLSTLRSNGLIVVQDGQVTAAEVFFLDRVNADSDQASSVAPAGR